MIQLDAKGTFPKHHAARVYTYHEDVVTYMLNVTTNVIILDLVSRLTWNYP